MIPAVQPSAAAVRQPSQPVMQAVQPPAVAERPASQPVMQAVQPTASVSTRPAAASVPAPALTPSELERESGEQPTGAHPRDLSDELLQAVSTALRGFPEVEWACVMHDASDIPILGVRVDPSFMSRVAQITDAVIGLAHQHGGELQVLLLSTPELVRGARKDGKAFYPWKR
jgi:hypothetical protein